MRLYFRPRLTLLSPTRNARNDSIIRSILELHFKLSSAHLNLVLGTAKRSMNRMIERSRFFQHISHQLEKNTLTILSSYFQESFRILFYNPSNIDLNKLNDR